MAGVESEGASRAPAASCGRKARRGDELEVEVAAFRCGGGLTGSASDGGVAYRVELRRGVPGERVRARVLARRKDEVRARRLELLRPSPHTRAARCAHFEDCGGCAHQDLDYARQCHEKRDVVERVLRACKLVGGPGDAVVEAVLPCDPPWGYRNKMDFTFGAARYVPDAERLAEDDGGEPTSKATGRNDAAGAGALALGLHPAGQFRKVLDVTECAITFPEAAEIVNSARELALALGLEAWDVARHAGLLRHLVLRKSFARGSILANLVTSAEETRRIEPYVAALSSRHPEITTLVQTVASGVALVAHGESERTLHGSGTIVEELCGLAFRLSARSFFQTNTRQAEHLVERVRRAACARDSDIVFDLYCGAGALTLALARDATQRPRGGATFGFELVPEAVADARENARANGITNVEFRAGDVLTTWTVPDLPAPDALVVDPPRAGLHPKVVDSLGRAPARRLVYVSCNIQSAARDCARLRYLGWRLARVEPLDLFPHTPHVETVLTLERTP